MANGFILRSLPFTPTALSALASGSAAGNVTNDFVGMVARANASNTALILSIDLGAPLVFDTFAALNILADTPAASVRIFGGNDPTYASVNFLFDLAPPATENLTGTKFRHAVGAFAPVAASRYVAFRIEAAAGITGEVARILIGSRFQPVRNFEWGLQRGAKDLGELQFSGRGALLRRRGRILRTLQISWPMLSDNEAEAGLAPLIEAAGNQEFLLVHQNPDAGPERSRRTWFGPVQGDPSIAWRHTNGHEHRLQLVSVI